MGLIKVNNQIITVSGSFMNYTAPSIPSFDPDAQAFFDAAGITDSTQKSAVNTLVLGLKTNSLWTKFYALYPYIGGTATSHKYNLKDPRDLDAAYRLNWYGGWTHDSNGITPNGSNAYADTLLNASAVMINTDLSIMFYSRSNHTRAAADIGCDNGSYTGNIMFTKWTDQNTYWCTSDNQLDGFGNIIADTSGLLVQDRSGAARKDFYRNGVSQANTSNAPDALPNVVHAIGSNYRVGGAQEYSNRVQALTAFGQSFSVPEHVILNTLIQAFQTTLSRNI